MRIDEKMAEIAGAFAADGCMQKDYICMWGNIYEEQEYYNTVLFNLFKSAFGVNLRLHPKQSNSVYGFYLCGKEIVKFFSEKLGFPIGVKTYTMVVPEVILKETSLWPSFIRGFADGDGCINFSKRKGTYSLFKRTRHTYPRILLSSSSNNFMKQIKQMLDTLGVRSTLIIAKSGRSNLPITKILVRGVERVNKWFEIIGFSNSVQITRFQIWRKFGYCPPYTTLAQRKAILNGELNLEDFYEKNGPGRIRTDDP